MTDKTCLQKKQVRKSKGSVLVHYCDLIHGKTHALPVVYAAPLVQSSLDKQIVENKKCGSHHTFMKCV